MTESLRIGFIGAGRVAKALARAFAQAGERVVAVASRTHVSAEDCARGITGCAVMDSAQQVVDGADLVFLAVPDDAIASIAASLHWRASVVAVHCSGASELAVLETARAAGAQTGSFHPLLMFADPRVAALALPRSAIAVEAQEPLIGVLEHLVRRLGAQSLRVPPQARAAYHAASHYGAAFLCVLLDQGMKILAANGMPGDIPRKALLSLAHGTLDALEQADPAQAMAGVYARGDAGTAKRHLQALEAMNPDVAALYRALGRRSVLLAEEVGRIDRVTAASMRELLRANPVSEESQASASKQGKGVP